MEFSKAQIGLGIISIIMLIGFVSVSQFGSPFTILSSSDVTFESNSDWWDGEAIVVNWAEDGSTENIQITTDSLSESFLESVTGQEVDGNIEITASYTNTEGNYDYNDISEAQDPRDYGPGEKLPAYRYDPIEIDNPTTSTPDTSACEYLPGGPHSGDQDGWSFLDSDHPFILYDSDYNRFICYEYNAGSFDNAFLGHVASMDTPDITIETEFTITVGDNTYSETLTSGADGESSTFIFAAGERVGRIEWIGNLDDGNTFTNPSDDNTHVFLQDGSGDDWFIDQDNYNAYRNFYYGSNSGLVNELETVKDNFDYELSDVRNTITQQYVSIEDGGVIENVNDRSSIYDDDSGFYDGGYISSEGGAIPQYRLVLKATDIIVGISVGEPRIDGITSGTNDDGQVEIPEGSERRINYDVTNIGDSEGQFTGLISCQGSFSSESPQYTPSALDPGETKSFYHDVTFGGDQVETSSCDIEVYDNADESIRDTISFDVRGDPAATCFPSGGYNYNSDDEIYSCTGSSTEVVKTCSENSPSDRDFASYEADGDEYVFTTEEGDTFRLDQSEAYINDDSVSGSWSNTVIACGLGDDTGGSWLENISGALGLPTPGGDSGYADDCRTGLGFIDPVCSMQSGVEGFINATDEAMALFDIGFGLLVSIITGGILYTPYRRFVTESSETAIQVTGAIAIIGFSVLLGFLAFQWIQGLIPKLIIVGLLLSYVTIRSMIPGL